MRMTRFGAAARPAGDALLWAMATWGATLSLLGLAVVAHAVVGPGRLAGVVAFSVYAGAYVGVHMALALAPIVPALLVWAYAGRALGPVEARLPGVGVGTALLAWPAAASLAPRYDAVAPGWAVWLLVWALLLAPRVLLRRLRPGTFARQRGTTQRSVAADVGALELPRLRLGST